MTERVPADDLGAFLRARRAAASLELLPFVSPRARRVSGLRREEVAMLAGISVDYYTRLEQGRDARPSETVLNSLGMALALDDDERRYLYGLAGRVWHAPTVEAAAAVDPVLLQLMGSWPDAAVFVIDPLHTIIARNALADALLAPFPDSRNLVEMIFLDPVARDFYVDWEKTARASVASLRRSATFSVLNADRAAFISRLEAESPKFRQHWARHEVMPKTQEIKEFRHPAAGHLAVRSFVFELTNVPGHLMVVWQAAPGSEDERRLATLVEREPAMAVATKTEDHYGR